MGYQTDFVGYFHVQPHLNEIEIEFLNTVSGARLMRPGGPLRAVGGEDARHTLLKERSPIGWSNWCACSEGCCLSYDGGDKANHMIAWIKVLVGDFLAPGASAEGCRGFEDFTFDHFVNGMVVGSRRDNRQLYAITANDNEITTEMLWPGVPEWSDYPALRYQEQIDRMREWAAAYRLEEARDRVNARRREVEEGWWSGDE
jgi:hypothetical protein